MSGLPTTPRETPGQAFGRVYDGLPMGVVLGSLDNELVFANAEFFRLTECTAADLGYMNFEDVLSMFCLTMCAAMDGFHVGEDRWHCVDRCVRRSDGAMAWVRIHLSTLRHTDGQVYRQLFVDDVTKYKELIDGLVNSKDICQSIVETRPDPVCCFLPDWTVTFANASFSRCLRRRKDDALAESLLLLLPQDVRDAFRRAVESITPEAPVAEVEHMLEEDGRQVWLRWVVHGFFYKTGHVRDYQAIGMDISEQKLAESRFIHADRLVSLGTLVTSVAHEINNPNNFIMLNAPLLMDMWWRVAPALERLAARDKAAVPGAVPLEDIVQHVPQLLQGIIEGSSRIKTIVKELKQFARQDADSGFETLDVNDVVQSAVLLMSKTLGRHTTRFTATYAADLPPVRGRRQRLEQIVVNLVQNALNALEHSGQAVHLETLFHEASGSVRILVRDEGVGIRPEDLPRVTDPFYSTRRSHGGTGLGLSISLNIVREHGGRLLIESAPGSGTCVTVVLPAAQPRGARP